MTSPYDDLVVSNGMGFQKKIMLALLNIVTRSGREI